MSLLSLKMSEYSKEVKSHYITPFSYVLAGMAFFNSYIYYKTYHADSLAFYCLASGLAACLVPIFKKKSNFHYFTANYVIFVFFACITFLEFYSGGINSNAIWWLGTIPLVASFLLNACFGLIWFAIILINFITVVYLGNHDLLPINVLLYAPTEGRIIISFTMNALLISILCVLADLIRDKAYIEKEELRLKAFQLNQVASLGKLASGVAHEINNPLTVIKGSQLRIARLIEENHEIDKHVLANYMNKIQKNILRIQTVTGLMRTISEQGHDRAISEINLKELLMDVIQMLREEINMASATVETYFPERNIIFKGIYTEIFQAFFNIIENALQELNEKLGKRHISINLEQNEKAIIVLIEDNGRGISPQIRDHIFDPFFTTKSAGIGKGLGLSFSLNAFVSNGGSLELLDDKGGAIFKVTLPNGYN